MLAELCLFLMKASHKMQLSCFTPGGSLFSNQTFSLFMWVCFHLFNTKCNTVCLRVRRESCVRATAALMPQPLFSFYFHLILTFTFLSFICCRIHMLNVRVSVPSSELDPVGGSGGQIVVGGIIFFLPGFSFLSIAGAGGRER